MLGNFLGDFVKGKDFAQLPENLVKGILLHRKVDVFTDSHHLVKALKNQFPVSLRRISGVLLDVWFDHLLMRHNSTFSPCLETNVFPGFYQELQGWPHGSVGFMRVRSSLLAEKWLQCYRSPEACLSAFLSIERRLAGRLMFAHAGYEFMVQHSENIESVFLEFYPELIKFVKTTSIQLD